MDAWRLAVGTLTAIPVRPPAHVDRTVASRAMVLAPIAAIPLGAAVTLLGLIGQRLDFPDVSLGVLAVAMIALGNRALHWDGLADTVDGLSASYDRDRALRIMREGPVGPSGVLALVITIGLQIVGFSVLLTTTEGAIVAGLAVCLARCALPTACATFVPSARPDGLGATVAGSVHPLAVALWWVVAAGLLTAFVGISGAMAALVALLAVAVLVAHSTRRLGGVTGDVLGAAVEMTMATLVVALAVGF